MKVTKEKLTNMKAAVKADICACPEGIDFLASETESGSVTDP